ncbi:hypothetical protein HU200_048935 [Digitaria exilis]|uniref:DUF4220 domain-containing protein n=1 Tax=Digitaria exilis TaxID=1010633 RepID=A0A835E933_9POAL|nr:hypothetical protein HU200_048935 [Digitaria exilis]
MSPFNTDLGRFFKIDHVTRTANVELWVVLTTLLLVVKFALDSVGPWYFNKFMLASTLFLEGLNSSMVQYTLGLMQLSSTKNDFFQVWAVLMVTLRYSVKVGRPYGRSKKLTLSDMMSSLWTANLLKSKTSSLLIALPLWSIWFINAARIIAYFVSSEKASRINKENLRLVTDYMRHEHESTVDADPVTMAGYRYLVSGEDEQDKRVRAPEFEFKLDVTDPKLVTVERVWRLGSDGDKLLGNQADADVDNRYKDVCLSFALYKLQRRRFVRLPSHEDEVARDKTRQMILDGVLRGVPRQDEESEEDEVAYAKALERAFRVTEVELSFLQDSFHGNHAVVFVNGFPVRRLLLSVALVAALSFVAYPVYHIPSRTADKANLITVTRGVPVSYGIIFLIIVKELCEIIVYVFSQWTKVWMLCMYITKQKLQSSLMMQRAVRVMFRLVTRGQWDQHVGQYNILIQCLQVKLSLSMLRPTRIKLPTVVNKKLLKSLKNLQDQESLKSYFPNAFGSNQASIMEKLSWANEFEADSHRILVWHIATCLCEIKLCGEVSAASLKPFRLRPKLFFHSPEETPEAISMWGNYATAVTLSNYCAYLLTREPRLVPDNGLVAAKVFLTVKHEVYLSTRRCRSLQAIYDLLGDNPAVVDGKDKATVKMGAELARQLLETDGNENRVATAWQILAKFWSGFLLHLAASTKAEKHKIHLQGRGELITHLWALLSHAGLLGTSSDDESPEIDLDGTAE